MKTFLLNVEWLAVRYGVEITYDAEKEWFTVTTGDGSTFSNIDIKEAVSVAYDFLKNGREEAK